MAQPFDFPQLRAAADILAAETAVADARLKRSREGGNVDRINAANSRLAEAHCRYREISDGRVPDRR